MPIYEFQCKTCEYCFEEILPANFEAPPECPRCKSSEAVIRLLSACVTKTDRETPSSCVPRGGFS